MTHRYSLRPNAKGRRGPQGTDETDDDQVEGTSTSTSISTSLPDEELEDKSGTVDPRPATPDTPTALHNPPTPTQDPKHQTTADDRQRHSRSTVPVPATSPVVISAPPTTTTTTTTKYHRIEWGGRPVTWDDIQAARKREEARRVAEAVRIRREQVGRGYREELRALRARIVALRGECEVAVEKARRKWERAWAVERGEVAVVVGEEKEGLSFLVVGSNSNSNWQDADGEMGVGMGMAVDRNYVPAETSSSSWSRSESNFLPPPPPLRRTQQQQQPHMGPGTFPLSGMCMGMAGPSQLEATEKEKEDDDDDEEEERAPGPAGETHTHIDSTDGQTMSYLTLNHHPSQDRISHSSLPLHPRPLRRQPAQLMVIPT